MFGRPLGSRTAARFSPVVAAAPRSPDHLSSHSRAAIAANVLCAMFTHKSELFHKNVAAIEWND